MLRVGLTGGLGSGKSTAAKMFAALGAQVLQADVIGRELMEPGQQVYCAIVARFGIGVVLADGRLDRTALARIAFEDGRVEDLNAIVHPAAIARQMELIEVIFRADPNAVVIVESALIFETNYSEASTRPNVDAGAGVDLQQPSNRRLWHSRFDRIVLVTASEESKIARFVARSTMPGEPITAERRAELEAEALRRLARQIPDERKASMCDYVLTNGGSLTELEWQVDRLWPILQALANGQTQ
ncbi:dephospho-CoA kinase [Granulicella sp. L60]|uniref:dephospho-CoA kinase n=1 Tax=Granulicella sp. L60 TaxID=1641866 RepID=UPI00131D2B38|nr:dephospho-CoA kinase [Granulicella sp. L60]